MTNGPYYLKWTRKGRVPSYQGGQAIPTRKWTDRVTGPVLCERGWHACRWEDVLSHVSDELWVCQLDGVIVAGADKVAGERLRLVRQVMLADRALRLFGAAARDAAWDAARAAARDAALAAAGDAERAWQTDRLLAHYAGLDPDDFAHRPGTS